MALNRGLDRKAPRSLEFALFAIGFLWLLASRAAAGSAAQGISQSLHLPSFRPLLVQLFLLTLLLMGFTALHWVGLRNGSLRRTNALPFRPTMGREWQKGAALGWALLLVAVLPMALVGDLHPEFSFSLLSLGTLLLSVVTLLLGALAMEMSFRGFLFERLIRTVGPTAATLLQSAVYAFLVTSPWNNTRFSFAIAFVGGVLFSVAYLRTHALWLGWGLRFGWLASMAVLFGLPIAGSPEFSSVVVTDSSGQEWLTGGAYGPDGAVFTGLVLLAGAVVVFLLTRDYAWQYTHEPIVAGGRAVEVAPPAAHTAMEAAAAPPPLIQIAGTTPSGFSAGVPPPPSVRPAVPPARVDVTESSPQLGGAPRTPPVE